MLPVPPMAVSSTAAPGQAGPLSANGSPSGAGGYVFSPEEIDDVIEQWKGLLDTLENDEQKARDIADVHAPGLEFASGDYKGAAEQSGHDLVLAIMDMRDYVRRYIDALIKAKEATEQTDENSGDAIPGSSEV